MKHAINYTVHLLCFCLLLVCTAWFSACKKFIEVSPPPDVLVSSQVFTDDAKAIAVVTSIYGNMINGPGGFSNYQATLSAGFSADELDRFNPPSIWQEFTTNTLAPNNSQVKNLWLTAYKTIYYANAVLEGLQASDKITLPVKQHLIGECKFIRAFCNFYLVNFFGDVPLVLSTDYRLNAILPRSPVSVVFDQVTDDLKEAKTSLPLSSDRTRAGKSAASALLARVYLYRQQWNLAEQEATEVINSGMYSPLTAVANVFLSASKETIFQLVPTTGPLTELQNIRPLSNTPQVYLTARLMNTFSNGDVRRTKWIDSITYQSVKYYYPAKYRSTATTPTEYYVVLRLAEQYLVRAEARLQKADLNGAVADINMVKQRAGVALLSTNATPTQVANEIEKERLLEFFAEWGHRWFDLKRWGRATTLLAPLKPSWQSTKELFPVPEDELMTNPFLTQNPGY